MSFEFPCQTFTEVQAEVNVKYRHRKQKSLPSAL